MAQAEGRSDAAPRASGAAATPRGSAASSASEASDGAAPGAEAGTASGLSAGQPPGNQTAQHQGGVEDAAAPREASVRTQTAWADLKTEVTAGGPVGKTSLEPIPSLASGQTGSTPLLDETLPDGSNQAGMAGRDGQVPLSTTGKLSKGLGGRDDPDADPAEAVTVSPSPETLAALQLGTLPMVSGDLAAGGRAGQGSADSQPGGDGGALAGSGGATARPADSAERALLARSGPHASGSSAGDVGVSAGAALLDAGLPSATGFMSAGSDLGQGVTMPAAASGGPATSGLPADGTSSSGAPGATALGTSSSAVGTSGSAAGTFGRAAGPLGGAFGTALDELASASGGSGPSDTPSASVAPGFLAAVAPAAATGVPADTRPSASPQAAPGASAAGPSPSQAPLSAFAAATPVAGPASFTAGGARSAASAQMPAPNDAANAPATRANAGLPSPGAPGGLETTSSERGAAAPETPASGWMGSEAAALDQAAEPGGGASFGDGRDDRGAGQGSDHRLAGAAPTPSFDGAAAELHAALRDADLRAAAVRESGVIAEADGRAPTGPNPGADLASLAPPAPVSGPNATAPTASANPYAGAQSAAGQVAPALVSMFQSANGTQRMTLKLRPDDLGEVEIRIETTASGPAHVAITVEKPETLKLMLQDQAQLQRALDLAGLPTDGRSVTFHIAPADPANPGASDPAMSAFTAPQGGQGSAWGREAGGRHGAGGSGDGSGAGGGSGRPGDDPDPNGRSAQRGRWLRAGVDITA